MVRNYVRKTARGDGDEAQMRSVIEAVQKKELSVRKAAMRFPFQRMPCTEELKEN